MWKLRKFTFTHFWQTFRESKVTFCWRNYYCKSVIWRNFYFGHRPKKVQCEKQKLFKFAKKFVKLTKIWFLNFIWFDGIFYHMRETTRPPAIMIFHSVEKYTKMLSRWKIFRQITHQKFKLAPMAERSKASVSKWLVASKS